MQNKEYANVMSSLGFHNPRSVYNSWNGNTELYADEFANEKYGFYYFQEGLGATKETTIEFLKGLASRYVKGN